MHLQESGEMYLETILILSRKNGTVRSIDISEYMDYSKPSVSRAMGLLRTDGYITLTDSGRKIAEKIYERHNVLAEALKMLGVSETAAVADACKIEHDISDESFEAIKRHLTSKK